MLNELRSLTYCMAYFMRRPREIQFRLAMILAAGFAATSNETARATPTPIVYTGTFHNKLTGRDQVARLAMTVDFKPSETEPRYSGVITVYFGQDNSREYVALFYNPVTRVNNQRPGEAAQPFELLFMRDDDGRGQRLPTIRLKFTEDRKAAAGNVYSHSEGDVGTIELKSGWTSDAVNPVRPLGGIYFAGCGPSDGSYMVLRDMELVPSRILAEKSFPEAALGVINYIGNGTCHGYENVVNCVNIQAGTYDFYTGDVLLQQGSWVWNCVRDGDEALECRSNRYRQCRLDLAKELPLPVYQPINRPDAIPLPEKDVETPRLSGDCDSWDGEFNGILNHYLGGRRQQVKLHLVSLPAAANPDVCELSGTVTLTFQENDRPGPHITFPIAPDLILAGEKDIVLHSDENTDLTLQVYRDDQDVLTGNWISQLYGLVGHFDVERDRVVAPVRPEESVQGISGTFRWMENQRWKLTLDSIESGYDDASYDPYVQLRVTGSLDMDTELDSRSRPIRTGGFGRASYDYFTNTFVVRAGWILSGSTAPEMFSLRGVSSVYMSLTPDRGLWSPMEFKREID